MNVKIADLMSRSVIVLEPHETAARARSLIDKHGIHALPVVGSDGRPVGVVSGVDLLGAGSGDTPVRSLMSDKVWTIPQYNGPHQAARLMRKHRIHHVVVTHEKEVIGILSSWDLLQLVEERRFTMKAPPA